MNKALNNLYISINNQIGIPEGKMAIVDIEGMIWFVGQGDLIMLILWMRGTKMKKTSEFLERIKNQTKDESVFINSELCQKEIQDIKDEIDRLYETHSEYKDDFHIGLRAGLD
jgi:hypothetical protein